MHLSDHQLWLLLLLLLRLFGLDFKPSVLRQCNDRVLRLTRQDTDYGQLGDTLSIEGRELAGVDDFLDVIDRPLVVFAFERD